MQSYAHQIKYCGFIYCYLLTPFINTHGDYTQEYMSFWLFDDGGIVMKLSVHTKNIRCSITRKIT